MIGDIDHRRERAVVTAACPQILLLLVERHVAKDVVDAAQERARVDLVKVLLELPDGFRVAVGVEVAHENDAVPRLSEVRDHAEQIPGSGLAATLAARVE